MPEIIRPLKGRSLIVPADTDDTLAVQGIVTLDGDMTFQDPNANGGVQLTLSDLSASGGVSTFDALLDTPQTKLGLAGRYPRINDDGATLGYSTVPPPVSGLTAQGGALSVASTTEVGFSPGNAELIQKLAFESRERPTNWSAQNITSTRLSEAGSFWVLTDAGFTGTATIVERSVAPTNRAEALLGVSIHRGGEVIAVIDTPDIFKDQDQLVREFTRRTTVRRDSGTVEEIPLTLTSFHTIIELFGANGLNYQVSTDNAYRVSVPASAGSIFFDTIKPDGIVFNTATAAFPKTWNDGGVETALTGKKAVVHQVAIFKNGYVVVQLGTTEYKDYATASTSMVLETLGNPLWIVARKAGAHIANVVVAADAVFWADGKARIHGVFDGIPGDVGVSSFIGLSDSPQDYVGAAGQSVTVNLAENGLEFTTISGGGGGVLACTYAKVLSNISNVGSTPGPINYDFLAPSPNSAFLTYSSPDFTVIRDSTLKISATVGFSTGFASNISILRLEIVKNLVTQLSRADAGVYFATVDDNQVFTSRTFDFFVGDTFRIYCYTLIGTVDVWGDGQNWVQVEVIKDNT